MPAIYNLRVTGHDAPAFGETSILQASEPR